MLSYYKGGYNDYMIRTAQLPSGSKFLLLSYQDMITLENSSVLFDPNQWTYDACESFVSFSVNFDINTNYPVGTEFRLTLTPAVSTSTIPFTYMDDVWNGSIQFYASQSIDKPVYKTQNYEFISHDSDNEYIIIEPFNPITTTTTSGPTTTTTLAPTTTTTTTSGPTTTTTTAAPGVVDAHFFLKNQVGGQGFDVCISGSTNGNITTVILDNYSLFMSSDSNCTVPYGTSWNQSAQAVYGFTGPGQVPCTSGGSLSGTYYRTRVTGSLYFAYTGGGTTPYTNFDISGSGYVDYTANGYTLRIHGAGCALNDNTPGCS